MQKNSHKFANHKFCIADALAEKGDHLYVYDRHAERRARARGEIGTPLCVTIDFETVGDAEKSADNCVTVRDRDTMEQVRIPIAELKDYIEKKIAF